jgi:hypothetical protein
MATRMKKETRNLIILGASIVAIVALSIMLVFFYNKYWKKAEASLSDAKYADYVISDYSKLLSQEKKTNGGNYAIYCYSSSATGDANLNAVMSYIDLVIENREEIENGETTDYQIALYVIDYDKFDSTSDETETANAPKIEEVLGYKISGIGTLIYISDNKLLNTSKQVITSSSNVKQALKTLKKENKWPYEV